MTATMYRTNALPQTTAIKAQDRAFFRAFVGAGLGTFGGHLSTRATLQPTLWASSQFVGLTLEGHSAFGIHFPQSLHGQFKVVFVNRDSVRSGDTNNRHDLIVSRLDN